MEGVDPEWAPKCVLAPAWLGAGGGEGLGEPAAYGRR